MIYFYLHYGNVNTNQRWKGLVNILHCTCVKIVGVYKVKVIYMYYSFIQKKNCIGHGGFHYFSQEKIGKHFCYLLHYISLFVCLSVTEILARTFEVYKIRLYILLSSLKVNVRYQSQVKVIT